MPNRYSFSVLTPKSSAISAIAYDADTFELTVTFRTGRPSNRKWLYRDVPEAFARGLKEAKSTGGYFRENIRGQFRGSIDHAAEEQREDLQEKLRQSIEAALFIRQIEEEREALQANPNKADVFREQIVEAVFPDDDAAVRS